MPECSVDLDPIILQLNELDMALGQRFLAAVESLVYLDPLVA
jgi:hypothetical protein